FFVDERDFESQFSTCSTWPTRPSDPGALAAATFDGPTLAIGGVLDPGAPAVWAEHVASTLPHGQLVVIPTGGHGVLDACGAGLKGAFVADPARAVDATCATQRKLSFFYKEQKPLTAPRLRSSSRIHVGTELFLSAASF